MENESQLEKIDEFWHELEILQKKYCYYVAPFRLYSSMISNAILHYLDIADGDYEEAEYFLLQSFEIGKNSYEILIQSEKGDK